MRVAVAGEADVAALLEKLDGAVAQTLQARPASPRARLNALTLRRADARRRRLVCRGCRRAASYADGHDGARERSAASGSQQRAPLNLSACRRRASRRSCCTA